MRGDTFHHRIGCHDHDHEAAVGESFQIGGQAGNVVAAPDHHRASAVGLGPFCRQLERPQGEPRSGKSQPVPGHGRRKICQHPRLSRLRHRTFFDLAQIDRQQREPVGVVAEQIAFDENFRHDVRLVGIDTAA